MLSKESIDIYLESLGNKIKDKFGEEANIKLVIVGGAAIVIQYKFRESTMDIDAFTRSAECLDDLVSEVADEYNLEKDWMNDHVTVTQSFTTKIENYAPEYKVFAGVLHIHIADALTLLCMKCVSYREGTHDAGDIRRIVEGCDGVTYDKIMERFTDLYGDLSMMSPDAQMYLSNKFKRMPPDVIDYIYSLLPENIKNKVKTAEDKYRVCSEYADWGRV